MRRTGQPPRLRRPHRIGIILVMKPARRASPQESPIARTIRFPPELRERIAVDAERCGRSFEAQVIAILRRHFGEDVDIAPVPDEILELAGASLAGIAPADRRRLTRKLTEKPRGD